MALVTYAPMIGKWLECHICALELVLERSRQSDSQSAAHVKNFMVIPIMF
jgi:hypothetical protein